MKAEPDKLQYAPLKKSAYSGAPKNFLKTNLKKQVLPQATQANILFVKGAHRPSTHS